MTRPCLELSHPLQGRQSTRLLTGTFRDCFQVMKSNRSPSSLLYNQYLLSENMSTTAQSLFLSTEWTGYSPPCGQREKKTPSMSEVLHNCGCSWCCLALRWQCVGFLGDLLTGMEYAVSSSPLSVPNTVPGIGGAWTTNGCDGWEVVSFSLKLILGDRHLLPL